VRAFALFLAAAIAAFAQEWQPMFDGKSLAGWKPTAFGGAGDVEVKDGELILHQGILTGINWTNDLPRGDFEIALEARRLLGIDFFCGLTFPVGDSFATWIVGGWGGAVVGLSNIDDQSANHNETTTYKRFEANRWYALRLRVTSTNIAAWIDEERVFDVATKGRQIAMRSGEIDLSKPLGIATWSTSGGLRNIRMRPLGAKPTAQSSGELFRTAGLLVAAARASAGLAHGRLTELCDRFGPRFSGSTNLEAAIDWAIDQMRADRLEDVRGEPAMVPRWIRGDESCELISPTPERLPMLSLGGSVGTPAEGLTLPVLVVTNFIELSNRVAEARGRIVVFDAAFTDYGDTVRFRSMGAVEASKAGAKASLIRSVGDFGLRTPHTGAMDYDDGVPKIPHGALAAEDTARLRRWQQRGVTPVVRLKMAARMEPDSLSRNVVAEIRGREFPEQVVIVSGHFDSWDVGRGAIDDGGGCIAAWEVLRLLETLELRPRRTIRCVLWTNEETGLRGAKAYRDQHRNELTNHIAAIESDNGVTRPEGFRLTGSDRAAAQLEPIARFLGERLGAGKLLRGGPDADVSVLLEHGVPCLGLRVDRDRYFWFHHTDADTPDKIDPRDMAECTAVLAVMAYALAEMPEPLAR
jgi:carboxypeptidase Q